ncbi:hypothetical protein [Variovorax saccharolyticus]|uniref:hypothetical protein n=1 Tax=Variovorax saccharolyticus TaxID=3053516 RepID=UPI00257527F9|nr:MULTISPECIES: hypothetical protein [unclassified Variovorax]MDM0022259.1 hypothetical protein [Variovorax sp. J22R187]MDM0028815.1 hypothetical protein [Variovorax sp. J31P216]
MKRFVLTTSVVAAQLLAASASAQSAIAEWPPSAIERHAKAYAIARHLEVDASAPMQRLKAANSPADAARATTRLAALEPSGSARWLQEDEFAENDTRSQVTTVDLLPRH